VARRLEDSWRWLGGVLAGTLQHVDVDARVAHQRGCGPRRSRVVWGGFPARWLLSVGRLDGGGGVPPPEVVHQPAGVAGTSG
jgi:hypothetical protein